MVVLMLVLIAQVGTRLYFPLLSVSLPPIPLKYLVFLLSTDSVDVSQTAGGQDFDEFQLKSIELVVGLLVSLEHFMNEKAQ